MEAPEERECLGTLTLWHDTEPDRPGPVNMALDELLLASSESPWLRWYGWDRPTISVGYFETVPEDRANGLPVVRRWTGGGSVWHGGKNDHTYALGVPKRAGEPNLRPQQSYRLVHSALVSALQQLGIGAVLAACENRSTGGGSCFSNPVEADVLGPHGEKIAGAAQRRTRMGLLHQGSIQGVELPSGFEQGLATALCEGWQGRPLPPEIVDRAAQVASERYPFLAEG